MSHFLAMISRMKYIDRWALMRNSRKENLSEHALEVSMIAHLLAVIGNKRYNKHYDAARAAVLGLYHDATEIITGDMPTPIKYYNQEMRGIFASIEDNAAKQLVEMLPEDLSEEYKTLFFHTQEDEDLWKLVKAADKLSALIKCLEEESTGNKEFVSAKKATKESIKRMGLAETEDFIKEFLPSYEKTLDELN